MAHTLAHVWSLVFHISRGFQLNLVPVWLKTYVLFVIELEPYQPFLMFSAKTISMMMRLMKTGVRFWALYFPISFQMKLTNKLTLQGIFLVTTLVILLFIPQLIISAHSDGKG